MRRNEGIMRYQIKGGLVQFAADTILENINFEIRDNEKIAIVGRNGCGKTTLLRLIAGMIELSNIDSDEGCGIAMAGKQEIGFLRQISFEDESLSIEQELLKVYEPVFAMRERMQTLEEKMQTNTDEKILEEYGRLSEAFEDAGGYTYRQDMETIFQKFGFPLENLQRPLQTMSGGQQTKIAFVKLLLSRPDIMLLDEPTNHLDMPTIEWLEGYLKNYKKAVVIVSHDRMFLDAVTDVTYEIEYTHMKRYPGNYSAFVERKRLDSQKQEKDYQAQQKEIARLMELVERFKNKPTKVAMTRSKLKQIEHMDKIEKPVRYDLKAFHAQFAPRIESAKEVLVLEKLLIGYEMVLNSVTATIKRGHRVAVIGENGKGKSTLLKTIMGITPELGGHYQFGMDVEVGYFDQQMAQYSSEKTVIDELWDEYPTMTQTQVRTALGNFLFSGDEVFKKVNMLSGGEKVRLALVKIFKKQPNFLLLDEPTNHMDIVGKQALELMLKNYEGTILFVSHDRYFIKEIATDLLVFENGEIHFYDCGYEEYLERRNRQSVPVKKVYESKAKENKEPDKIDNSRRNPGKEETRRKQKIQKFERLLEEGETRVEAYTQQMNDPLISSDYQKLNEIHAQIEIEEKKLEEYLVELDKISE